MRDTVVDGVIRPDFIVIGAQRAGTTWLWNMLKQHPGVSLPATKEIHFFGSAELYAGGKDWYYAHFRDLDSRKVVGEASTTYLYDRIPYWHNKSRQIEFDASLPCIPELITQELPSVKILVMLRDPVSRAVSAYKYWMRRVDDISPFLGLKETAIRYPKMRILEYGFYARYLELWRAYIPPERMRVLVFEEDVAREPSKTVREVYEFLGLDPDFPPKKAGHVVHRGWTWTRILVRHFTHRLLPRLSESRFGSWFDRHDVLARFAIRPADIEFLRSEYLPERPALERLLNRSLDCWTYGRERLTTSQKAS